MEERITLLQSSNLFVPVQCATVPRLGVHEGLEEKSTDRRYVSPEGSRLNGFIGRNGGWGERVVGFRGCSIENRDSFGEILVEILCYESLKQFCNRGSEHVYFARLS